MAAQHPAYPPGSVVVSLETMGAMASGALAAKSERGALPGQPLHGVGERLRREFARHSVGVHGPRDEVRSLIARLSLCDDAG